MPVSGGSTPVGGSGGVTPVVGGSGGAPPAGGTGGGSGGTVVSPPGAWHGVTSATAQSMLASEYASWKSSYYRDCGGTACIADGDRCVSEGVAYGMMLAVGMDDRAAFDALWGYYTSHTNSNGVMNWETQACGGTWGEGGASDEEVTTGGRSPDRKTRKRKEEAQDDLPRTGGGQRVAGIHHGAQCEPHRREEVRELEARRRASGRAEQVGEDGAADETVAAGEHRLGNALPELHGADSSTQAG